jgi:Cys-rich repeat protein
MKNSQELTMRRARRPHNPALGVLAGAMTVAIWHSPAAAQVTQTWSGGRTTPTLGELIAVDATGETGWPYGAEDIEGDGLGTFRPAEQSLDIRTAYATADASAFWLRVYVSDENGVGGSVTIYAFIDADEDPTTGGGAAATDIDPALDSDPTSGGYEYVIAIRGNGTLDALYEWQASGTFRAVNPLPAGADAEASQDDDPIAIGAAQHGYAQASVPLSAVGLTSDCAADIFVRSVNDSASTTASDLNVASAASCVPVDVNADGIPDTVVPPECTSDAQCPAGGVCASGSCVIAAQCQTDADCAADEQCTQGVCVAVAQGTCSTTADCGALVCVSGQCQPCTASGATCGAGQICAPDGRCVTGTPGGTGGTTGGGGIGDAGPTGAIGLVDDDENVQGGACTCRAAGAAPHTGGLAWAGLAIGALTMTRRRQRASK